ncbi:hypothetical protein [Flaviaesturariibacter amylovorans]|uniref:Uncharacterized protein n=1 Tax=Flaviaesturariibacter amylovorans TaxID=1084520 RepID=A0ABP8HUU2_9BACT
MLLPPVLSLKVEAIGRIFYFLYADGAPLSPARLLPGKPVAEEYELTRNADGSWPRLEAKARVGRGGYLRIGWTDPATRRPCDQKLWHHPDWQEETISIGAPVVPAGLKTPC